MQKKLIALAVAGLVSAPAFAQSNVTVYGVVDAYVGFGSHGDNDFSGVNSAGLSGSRIGFRGTEDLGNGLKAVFTVEQGFAVDSGTGLGDASRQAFVGLNGGFGTVSLGRQYAPGYHATANYDVFGAAAVSPLAILVGAPSAINGTFYEDGVAVETLPKLNGLSIAPNSAARWNNSVAYTGSFSGLTVRGIYSANAVETNTYKQDGDDIVRTAKPRDDDAWGLGVDYANGPLAVGAVYHYLKGSTNQKEWLLAGSYDFGVVKLLASYQEGDNASFVKDLDVKVWQVGALVPVSAAGNVHVAYGEAKYDLEGSAKAKSFGVAYTHALSKRTTAYAGANYTKNDDGLTLGAVPAAQGAVDYNSGATAEGLGFKGNLAESGEKSKIFVVGVRHTF